MTRGQVGRWSPLLGTVLVLAALAASPLPSEAQSIPRLVIRFMDVGQGDATLVSTPNGHTVLVNCGPSAQGKQLVLRLESAGISQIDTLAVSSVRADAAGGCGDVLNYLSVGQVVWSGRPGSNAAWAAFQTSLGSSVPAVTPTDDRLQLRDWGDGVVATVLSPPAAVGASSLAEADGSLALLVEYAGARILLSGPQDDSQQAAFVARTGGSPIDVLQVPDHGSAGSVSDDFLANIFPSSFMGQIRLAVLSYSARDVLQPDPGVLTRLTNAHAQVLSTAANGAITLTISSDGTPPVIQTER
jgi:competence protein ComEC